ncbi:MAG: type II toxin-antitoxin system YoeB family toxin [Oscillospiraceae bacterium]|nr:type II toxin-antitoxin system YoeB family toxin [Oscillospiraceae bacterium]
MKRELRFTPEGWAEFLEIIVGNDKKLFKKTISIILDTLRNGEGGIGHPEPLKGNYAGYWSKETDEKNRVVFKVFAGHIEIYKCLGHYSDH